MKNLGLQPTSKTSSSLSDEDAFLEVGNFNLEETNEDLKGKRASNLVKYQRISQRISFTDIACAKHLRMTSLYSKCVAFTAFAFWHRVLMLVQI